MEKLIYLFGLILLLFSFSCLNEGRETCSEKIEELIDKSSSINLEGFLGLTLNYRGKDEEGEWLIRAIQLNRKDKSTITIPCQNNQISIEKLKESGLSLETLEEDFTNVTTDIVHYLNQICKDFRSLNVIEINSQLHLGKFIEFELANDCSVYYKAEGAELNNDWQLYFSKAKKVSENWYIVTGWNTKPIIKELPDNFDTTGISNVLSKE